MVHQAIVIYSIPASLLFLTWLVLFGVVPAFDTLLPITAVGMLIWTKIEFDKVNKLKAQAAAMRKANKGTATCKCRRHKSICSFNFSCSENNLD
jgi:hypothetical protein